MCILEYNEIYNSILKEFHLSSSILEQMKIEAEALTKSRIEICNLLKLQKFTAEIIDINEKEIIINMNRNKESIEEYKKNQIELNDKIKTCKQEIKVIKFQLNVSENKLNYEQQESRELHESLYIFLKTEKFKFIKKIFVRKYINVFLKYPNQLSIKTNIYECNKRKEKLRKDKQNFNNKIRKNNKEINNNRIALSELRKKTINMKKGIEIFLVKIQNLNNYKKAEKKFRLEVLQCEKLIEKRLD